jgi:cell fate regulator YaaT (PSP1 superfamily)
MCGRLMCCLAYEYEYYEKVKKDLPKIGKKVKTKSGEGKVVRQNVLKGTVIIMLESSEEVEVSPRDIIRESLFKKRSRKEYH